MALINPKLFFVKPVLVCLANLRILVTNLGVPQLLVPSSSLAMERRISSSWSSSSSSSSSSASVHVSRSECSASRVSTPRSSLSLQHSKSPPRHHVINVSRRSHSISPSKFAKSCVLDMERQPLYECQRKGSRHASATSLSRDCVDRPRDQPRPSEYKKRVTNESRSEPVAEGVTVYYPSKSPMAKAIRKREKRLALDKGINKCFSPVIKLILILGSLLIALLLFLVLLGVIIEGHNDLAERIDRLEKRRSSVDLGFLRD